MYSALEWCGESKHSALQIYHEGTLAVVEHSDLLSHENLIMLVPKLTLW